MQSGISDEFHSRYAAMNMALFPATLYGSNISYFTGKMEMYLRVKGLPYDAVAMTGMQVMPKVRKATGVAQMPAVLLADGRWLTDTTPTIAWLEQQFPSPQIIPTAPEQRFFSLLLEDYADEWLWRPAMHFRWYSDEGAMQASRHLASEIMIGIPLPGWLKRWYFRRRQRGGYTAGDGINESNRLQVEGIYHNNLAWLSNILEQRPYLLGNSPSLADIAFMGPMFRHFSQDPIPAEIMRQEAPAVWEWVARLWNYDSTAHTEEWLEGVPEDWNAWLDDMGNTYLPYLCDNALAVQAGKTRFTTTVDGVTYSNARVSRYRVWCLEQLRAHYLALPASASEQVKQRLQQHGCWEPLWRIHTLSSGVNRATDPPFGSNAKML
jgi:glutathione S-transferase